MRLFSWHNALRCPRPTDRGVDQASCPVSARSQSSTGTLLHRETDKLAMEILIPKIVNDDEHRAICSHRYQIIRHILFLLPNNCTIFHIVDGNLVDIVCKYVSIKRLPPISLPPSPLRGRDFSYTSVFISLLLI